MGIWRRLMATNINPEELPEAKKDALKRLSYIEGHLAGIRRMVEEDKYCVDVLKQTFAVRRAIQKLEGRLLEGHLHSCVIEGAPSRKGVRTRCSGSSWSYTP